MVAVVKSYMANLVPRASHRLVFDCLQYAGKSGPFYHVKIAHKICEHRLKYLKIYNTVTKLAVSSLEHLQFVARFLPHLNFLQTRRTVGSQRTNWRRWQDWFQVARTTSMHCRYCPSLIPSPPLRVEGGLGTGLVLL